MAVVSVKVNAPAAVVVPEVLTVGVEIRESDVYQFGVAELQSEQQTQG